MSIPLGILEWIIEHPEIGWVALGGYLLFELRSKKGKLYALDRKITGAIIVIRALARKEEAINEDSVDEYLVENGMEPSDFFVEEDVPTENESLLSEKDNKGNRDERSAK